MKLFCSQWKINKLVKKRDRANMGKVLVVSLPRLMLSEKEQSEGGSGSEGYRLRGN